MSLAKTTPVQVSGKALQQVEKFKYLGVLFASDGTERLIHGLVKPAVPKVRPAGQSRPASFPRTV